MFLTFILDSEAGAEIPNYTGEREITVLLNVGGSVGGGPLGSRDLQHKDQFEPGSCLFRMWRELRVWVQECDRTSARVSGCMVLVLGIWFWFWVSACLGVQRMVYACMRAYGVVWGVWAMTCVRVELPEAGSWSSKAARPPRTRLSCVRGGWGGRERDSPKILPAAGCGLLLLLRCSPRQVWLQELCSWRLICCGSGIVVVVCCILGTFRVGVGFRVSGGGCAMFVRLA
ncbi:hypothetical protein B0H13DRAFT_1921265 [Mycena leptocephala]|nr:hypothetical protein B0H13DRAFT_1921265 [Mycena leptocephala]